MIENKSIYQANEQDLLDLISQVMPEKRSVEYIRILHRNIDHDKKEVLADVSSFANAHGGFNINGMAVNNGLLDHYYITDLARQKIMR